MRVRDGMSSVVLTVGPGHTLSQAARAMSERGVGAAVVVDPEQPGPGHPDRARRARLARRRPGPRAPRRWPTTSRPTSPSPTPNWSLERAAEAMVRGGFRHLVVVDGGDLVGVLSMRDIVRCWVQDGATSEMPREVAGG